MKNWKIKGKLLKDSLKERQKEIISVLLKNRRIITNKEKDIFFKPQDPDKLSLQILGIDKKEVIKAVKRVTAAITKKESIVIYGDYDADGICGTAILWEELHQRYGQVMPYLPHRIEEGYGLSKKGIDAVIKEYKPKLIITVDHGVTAKTTIEYAKKKGIDIIVTDHHVIPKEKPKPFALIHTTQISGSAVSWIFARELSKKLKHSGALQEKLSLCAIGTVSDVLPLTGVNRCLVSVGILKLRETKRPGLKALFYDAGIKAEDIDAYHIGYIIGPRINASGRLTHALDSLRLLCTKSESRGSMLAKKLGLTNRQRQKITEETLIHAKNITAKTFQKEKTKLIFISHTSYNQGIIGLVAGKLVDQYWRPAVVIAEGQTLSKASARSINGFDIISAIRQSSELLVDCGGHPMAAGFTVETVKIKKLKQKLENIVEKKLTDNLLIRSVNIDCEVKLSDLSLSLYEQLEKFRPFGLGNPEPLFATKNLQVLEARLVGKEGKHLKMRLTDKSGKECTTIAFGRGDLYPKLNKDEKINIIYSLTLNDWNGKNLEARIKDIEINS